MSAGGSDGHGKVHPSAPKHTPNGPNGPNGTHSPALHHCAPASEQQRGGPIGSGLAASIRHGAPCSRAQPFAWLDASLTSHKPRPLPLASAGQLLRLSARRTTTCVLALAPSPPSLQVIPRHPTPGTRRQARPPDTRRTKKRGGSVPVSPASTNSHTHSTSIDATSPNPTPIAPDRLSPSSRAPPSPLLLLSLPPLHHIRTHARTHLMAELDLSRPHQCSPALCWPSG